MLLCVGCDESIQRWQMQKSYVGDAQPGREGLAEQHLRRQEFVTFTPRRWHKVHDARTVRDILGARHRRAAFPGYLFASVDPGAVRWRLINGTIGVRHVTRVANSPLAMPQGFLEALCASADDSPLRLIRAIAQGRRNGRGDVGTLRGPCRPIGLAR